MTDKEKKDRIVELEIEIEKLRKEREKYRKQLVVKKTKNEIEERKKLVGRCFIQNINKVGNNYKGIKAFKILELLTHPNEKYAKCLVLYDGMGNNCWNEQSIKICVFGLWTKNTLYLMSDESDPNVIDFYKEISDEYFQILFDSHLDDLEKYLGE